MHHMKVQTKYYHLLKSGNKTIELRLFDEKRQKIKKGDEIVFSDLSKAEDCFTAVVKNLYHAPHFEALCTMIQPCQAGFASKEELLKVLAEFYTPAVQDEFGVVGIEIQKVS